MFPTVIHTTTPDCELSQLILPDLINDCHYPLRKGPHCYAVSRASDQWLTDVARLVEPEIRGYIDMDAGASAAVCYPDADAFHLRVCSDFLNWLFIIDDWMEYDVIDVQRAGESCIFAFRDPINFDTEQLGAKWCKSFFSRFRETAGPGCTERFIHGSEMFFAAVAKQVDDRAKGNVYNMESYITLRRVMSHPVVMDLEVAANDHVAWSNDILSYKKEMCKDAIQRFDSNRAILPSWGEEVDRQVVIYIEGLQNWMVGSLHWHFDSPRYFGKDRHAVKRDRIVKLLPKMPL
ncbi:isoprenoid synthase domain-containing protein [Suillus spraguei]|nr:isoprenoid synthase domain-containing protein [Suillus spraguei]